MAEIWQARIPHFLNSVLFTPAGSIPKGAQWIVAFEDLDGRILKAINLALSYERQEWKTAQAQSIVLSEEYQKKKGCVFCQAIDLPGESMVVNPEGNIMSNAFLRAYVGQGRNQYPEMRMTFLDTNVSFCENFLRPWAIATGAFGLISRPKNDVKNYRTNMVCYKLGAYDPNKIEILLKMTFYDICCVAVSDEAYDYQPVTGLPTLREARFIFNYYDIDTSQARSFQNVQNPNVASIADVKAGSVIKVSSSSLTKTSDILDIQKKLTDVNRTKRGIVKTGALGTTAKEYALGIKELSGIVITRPSSTLKANSNIIKLQKELTAVTRTESGIIDTTALGTTAKENALGLKGKKLLASVITVPSLSLQSLDLTLSENIKLDLNIV